MKQRIISAVVLLAIFIPILLIGKTPYAILMTVLAWMGLYELLKARKKKKEFPAFMEIIAYVLVTLFVLFNENSSTTGIYMDYRIIASLIFVYIIPMVLINDSKKLSLDPYIGNVSSEIIKWYFINNIVSIIISII